MHKKEPTLISATESNPRHEFKNSYRATLHVLKRSSSEAKMRSSFLLCIV